MDEINNQVDQMLKNGIIRLSESQYNSNVILAEKKDKSKRFVIDFRRLNELTIPDKYPIPNVDDLLENCHGSKYFTQLDLVTGALLSKNLISIKQLLRFLGANSNSNECLSVW